MGGTKIIMGGTKVIAHYNSQLFVGRRRAVYNGTPNNRRFCPLTSDSHLARIPIECIDLSRYSLVVAHRH